MALADTLAARLGNLPKIIAGPILRRVDAQSVTVWFASRVAFTTVTLRVLRQDGTTQVATGTGRTDPIGQNLHIGLVTATVPNASAPLTPGNIYLYAMSFDGQGFEAANIISAAGGSDALSRISYSGAGSLPSFSLPPAQIGQIRMLHGSCRKPHAESLDALQIADHLIRQDAGNAAERPHQLFLTGDQIYADDVGTPLLAIATDVGNTLLTGATGARETLPGVPADTPLGPDERQAVSDEQLGFTSTAAKNHLLTLAEFLAMYFLNWSDVLWPAELPAFDELFPGEAQTSSINILGLKLFESETKHVAAFKHDRSWLQSFKTSLRRVRRALANVPTYMIFDDHEITDDWYMNGDWAKAVFAKPAGLRVIQNGLAAYLLCQATGNDPAYFRGQPAYTSFVAGVGTWVSSGYTNETARAAIAAALPVPPGPLGTAEVIRPDRPLRFHFAIGWGAHRVLALDTRTWRRYPTANTIDAVLISGPGLDAQILDFGILIASAPPMATGGVYLVIAPSPVVGIPYLDAISEDGVGFVDFFKKLFGGETDSSIALDRDREILKLSAPAYDGTLSRVAGLVSDGAGVVLLSGDVHFGYAGKLEHWQPGQTADRTAFAQLTSSAFRNQSNEVKGFAPLAKLQTTTHLHHAGFRALIQDDDPPDPILRLTWQMTPAETSAAERRLRIGDAKIFGLVTVGGSYAKKDNDLAVVRDTEESTTFYENVSVTRPPNFITRTRVIPSSPAAPRPSTPKPVPTAAGDTQGKLQNHLDSGFNHHEVFFKADGPGQQVVGVNNIGRLGFQTSPLAVVQELWWWLPEARALFQAQSSDNPNQLLSGVLEPKPYSRQEVPLAIGNPPDTTVLK